MSNKKGAPPKFTPEMMTVVSSYKLKRPNWSVPEVYRTCVPEFKKIIENNIREEHPNWTGDEVKGEIATRLPGESSIGKYWKKLELGYKKLENNEFDKPWSITSSYPLAPEALPLVLAISRNKAFSPKQKLTIREAKWIGKLYTLVPENDRNDIIALNATLERWAEEFALIEQLTELSGIQPPSNRVESLENWIFIDSKVMHNMWTHTKEVQNER